MVVREIKVKDYFGNDRDYKLYFNMDEAEIMEYEFGKERGGISEFYARVLRAQDIPSVINALKDLIITAYGIPTADGESFQKSEEISRQFTYTKAYSDFMMKLYTDDAYGQAFLTDLIPQEVIDKIIARVEENQKNKEGNVVSMPNTVEQATFTAPTPNN